MTAPADYEWHTPAAHQVVRMRRIIRWWRHDWHWTCGLYHQGGTQPTWEDAMIAVAEHVKQYDGYLRHGHGTMPPTLRRTRGG